VFSFITRKDKKTAQAAVSRLTALTIWEDLLGIRREFSAVKMLTPQGRLDLHSSDIFPRNGLLVHILGIGAATSDHWHRSLSESLKEKGANVNTR
jgi:hypothetical protein